MKQTKKQPKKQPINVQLSKDDLKELLVVLKDFMLEEISRRDKMLFLNQSEIDKRVQRLEMVENTHRTEIHKLKQCCSHDDRFPSLSFSTDRNSGLPLFLALNYKCNRCGRMIEKRPWDLSRKEEKALKKLGVKI